MARYSEGDFADINLSATGESVVLCDMLAFLPAALRLFHDGLHRRHDGADACVSERGNTDRRSPKMGTAKKNRKKELMNDTKRALIQR